ncbi:hypothetical protein JCM24511_07816 [Saitozyma sp. JCM 24511]|nr:hypothetical protein JCM24511_07816 [Saitozyma sp. JCM 24511]
MSDNGDAPDSSVHQPPPPASPAPPPPPVATPPQPPAPSSNQTNGDTEHEDNALAGPSNGPGTQEAENTQTGQDPADTDADADADAGDNVNDLLDIDDDGVEQFDPATLANLAALSRIAQDEGLDEGEGQVEDAELLEVPTEGLSRDQVRELVENLRAGARERRGDETDKGEGGVEKSREDGQARRDQGAEDSRLDDRENGTADREDVSDGEVDDEVNEDEDGERDEPGDEDYKEGKYFYEKGKLKRRRNRTVLVQDDAPVNYELGLRVQALEALIRGGSNMDADTASAAAMETVLHATKAAGLGNVDAGNALAQLTNASLGLGGGMSQGEQNSLLMDVLQQLSAASMAKSGDRESGDAAWEEMRDLWSSVPEAPAETTTTITEAFDADTFPQKLNLGLPGFREDTGRIFIPPTVRYVEKKLRNENILAEEALPIQGYESFLDHGTRFAYGGDTPAYKKHLISSIQTSSITGALRLAATFLARFPETATNRAVYVPTPMTDEDEMVLREAGLDVRDMRFLDLKTGGVDWEGLREDLQSATPKSVVLLHISGTMPTGAELNASQWRLLSTILQERQLIPLCVMAFQGLSSGDVNRDAQPLRFMVHEGLPLVLAQSFDAMMGIYSDSPAIVSIPLQSAEAKVRVDSQLRAIARGFHLHPSPWGAHVVHSILSDAKLYPAWLNEIKAMSDRLRSVREKLFEVLANKLKTPGTWFHFKRASGMYCTTLLPPAQVEALTTKRHIHLLPDGSFSLGCLNAAKIDVLCRAIDHVVREGIREAEEAQAQSIAMELALAAAREAAAREEAEAAERAAREAEEAARVEEERARLEDAELMEMSIANAIEAQQRAEEEERMQEQERQEMGEAIRKAAERAEIARRAEEILASIGAGGL